MKEPIEIVQVLLLFDDETSRELGLALWAALVEIERFFNFDMIRGHYQRYYISPHVPSVGPLEAAWRGVGRLLGGRRMDDALAMLSQDERLERSVSKADVLGRYSGTYDQQKLGVVVRDLIGMKTKGSSLVVVTDRQLTPPSDSRYIIWDDINDGAVVSVVPTDPKYWRDRDPDRVSTVKRRVRSAGLSIAGALLGLAHCGNPSCFMYADVDSVTTLDWMTQLGEEHNLEKLSGRGFDLTVGDPTVVQPIVRAPKAGGDARS